MAEQKFMARALEIAAEAKDEAGALPYAAVVVKDGKIVGEGLNRAAKIFDPTSHGEIEAIRDACQNLETTDLGGADMYTTAEPCAMCVATMILANIGRLIYAADADDSAAFMRAMAADNSTLKRRYTTVELRAQVAQPPDARDMPAERLGQAEAVAVFEDFAATRKAT